MRIRDRPHDQDRRLRQRAARGQVGRTVLTRSRSALYWINRIRDRNIDNEHRRTIHLPLPRTSLISIPSSVPAPLFSLCFFPVLLIGSNHRWRKLTPGSSFCCPGYPILFRDHPRNAP